MKFISKKAAFPPLGLLTIAAMLPREWEMKLVDMNVKSLHDKDIKWADYVFVGGMLVQEESFKNVVKRCKSLGTRVVAGGPLPTAEYQSLEDVDHFVLNEAEITLPQFLADLQNGCAKHVYTSEKRPDIETTPMPVWDLIDMKQYNAMSVQYSRGCPFDCEFCDIVHLNGHIPRTKSKDQLLRELDSLYDRGWRSTVFIVDDNFIGNKKKLKTEILPAIIEWMKEKGYPFTLFTEASINLADDDELIQLVVEANFDTVFIGIETPSEAGLVECGKTQNRNRDLVASIKKLQNSGLQVQGGFIVGFDSDTPGIFESQISFIQSSGITSAMVGLLNALPGTKLYQRLKNEDRILPEAYGNNTDCSINFVPKMHHETLMKGYRNITRTIYSPKQYYGRVKTFLREYKPRSKKSSRLQLNHIRVVIKSTWFLGIIGKERRYYWNLLAWTLVKRPRSIPMSLNLAICGFHFRKVMESSEAVALKL